MAAGFSFGLKGMSGFLTAGILLGIAPPAAGELWRCESQGSASPVFTDTPTGGAGQICERVSATRFTRVAHIERRELREETLIKGRGRREKRAAESITAKKTGVKTTRQRK